MKGAGCLSRSSKNPFSSTSISNVGIAQHVTSQRNPILPDIDEGKNAL